MPPARFTSSSVVPVGEPVAGAPVPAFAAGADPLVAAGAEWCTAIQSELSPAKRKARTFSNSRLLPSARLTMASLVGGVGGVGEFGRPRRGVLELGYTRNATHLLLPLMPSALVA